jgi:hypothetical protein
VNYREWLAFLTALTRMWHGPLRALTVPEAAVAIFRITAVDLGCLDYHQPV